MDLKELENGIDQKKHWYYQSKKVPLFRYFEKVYAELKQPITVIDFGSGSGFFAYELLEAYPDKIKKVLLVDIGYSDAEMDATKGQIVEKMHFIPLGIDNSLVVMMDVLEHIEDDYAILEDIKKRLGNQAFYFITVPAFMSLWSGHDVFLGHYRRYRLSMLQKLLGSQRCNIEGLYYIYGSIFPLVWLVRRLKGSKNDEIPESSDMKPVPAPINAVLKNFNAFEMNFRYLNKLFGVTAVSEGRIK
jgi:pimeloyl-ACP methyl ester carboxylesterase